VQRDHPEASLNLTYIGGTSDANDLYGGLDRFGRVVDQSWQVDRAGRAEVQAFTSAHILSAAAHRPMAFEAAAVLGRPQAKRGLAWSRVPVWSRHLVRIFAILNESH